jgi:hypothetical protein
MSFSILREQRTVTAMIMLFCHGRHGTSAEICEECQELLAYALERVAQCPFQPNKPVCTKCPVHCYQPERRAQIRAVMRYAGPRMLWQHPILSLWYLWRQCQTILHSK